MNRRKVIGQKYYAKEMWLQPEGTNFAQWIRTYKTPVGTAKIRIIKRSTNPKVHYVIAEGTHPSYQRSACSYYELNKYYRKH